MSKIISGTILDWSDTQKQMIKTMREIEKLHESIVERDRKIKKALVKDGWNIKE